MDNEAGRGPIEGSGYDTPGQDTIIHSNSPAVPSPGMTSEQRLTTPKSRIEALGETPGDSNPALSQTAAEEKGEITTAELLMARETAEEEAAKIRGVGHPYQDQGTGAAPDGYERSDTGDPTFPDDLRQGSMEYMESPHTDSSLLGGSADKWDTNFRGRADAVEDRDITDASAMGTRSGFAPAGADIDEDKYEREEMHNPTEQSDLDRIAPGMLNVAPEDPDE